MAKKFKPQKGVTPPHLRKFLFKKGHGKVKKGASAAAARVNRGVSKAKGAAKRHARGFLSSMTPKKGVQLGLIVDGIAEGLGNMSSNAGRPRTEQAMRVLMPMLDGALSAKTFGVEVDHAAPGLMGDLWNFHLFRGDTLNATPRRIANAAPAGAGWYLAIQRYRELRKANPSYDPWHLLPRTGSMLGIQLRDARITKSEWIGPGNGPDAGTTVKDALLNGPTTRVVVGALGSKVMAKVTFI